MNIQESFKNSLNSLTPEEKLEINAHKLAIEFLSIAEDAMLQKGINKKQLAKKIGTSPSYITQLFIGDRKPNFSFLAKLESALDLKFLVSTSSELEQTINSELIEYHRKWVNSQKGFQQRNYSDQMDQVLSVMEEPENEFALAG
jgi:transcriptional regulator with XRE-family HTH domain